MAILAVNGGSSSIRFAIFEPGDPLRRVVDGKLDGVGRAATRLSFTDRAGVPHDGPSRESDAPGSAVEWLLDWLETQPAFDSVRAVGHRLVHGMEHSEPELVTPQLLDELRRITAFVPEHLPLEIELIEAVGRRHPRLPQVACFDTAFHRSMPPIATLLPIPRRYHADGIRRYGFHGLSCAFLMEELARVGDRAATQGRVILAHLGSGASLTAVRDGSSIDTSMAFTPAAGLVMGSRSGDLDPGLVAYLARAEQMTSDQFQHMVNHQSGLLGLSETSSDIRQLLACEGGDLRAAEALGLFCYQARKWIGAFAAALGGLDTLVFSGGIGEHQPVIRQRICAGLEFLGVALDGDRNSHNEMLISSGAERVAVRVIPTDEQIVIARAAARILAGSTLEQ